VDLEARFAELRELVSATPPEELFGAAARREGGAEGTLDLVFDWFRAGFEPQRTRGEEGIFHYEVLTPEQNTRRFVHVAGGTCTVTASSARPPNTTVEVDFADLLNIAVGNLRGSEPLLAGRLKITGDIFFAMNWSEWFGTRRVPGPEST
jgi:putative sterol carrier protein